MGREEIHLFSITGKYIRKLAQRGRGPEDVYQIWGYCVDEDAACLYLAEAQQVIDVIDLKEGKMLRKMPLQMGSPRALLLDKDGMLTYIALSRVKGNNQSAVCRMAPDGIFLGTIVSSVSHALAGEKYYLGATDHKVYCKLGLNDTLYTLQDSIGIPQYRMIATESYSDETGKGHLVDVAFGNKDFWILADVEIEVKKVGSIQAAPKHYAGYYAFHKGNAKLKKIVGFYIDPLDVSLKNYFPLLVSGKKAYWNMNVGDFRRQLEKKTDSPLVADSLKNLYYSLAENDNPLVLVGDMKQ